MYYLLFAISLFAQQGRFDRGMLYFKWGITGVGVAVLVAAVGVLLAKKSGDVSKELSPVARRIAAIVLGVLGVGIIAYAWFAF